jgi:hypothetical protein
MPVSADAPPAACAANCSFACAAAKRALLLPPSQRRKKAGIASLLCLLVPSLGFPLGIAALASQPAYHWLVEVSAWPWEFWIIGISGTCALIGGLGDWIYHRWFARCVIGKAERRCELLALGGGGVPLFAMMVCASASAHPERWIVPVMFVIIYTTALICYDEFIYHRRRCRRLETVLHRSLVFGNGLAFLAWAHWCFVKGGLAAHA